MPIIIFCLRRELLWHAFVEFLSSAIPSVDIHRLKYWIYNIVTSWISNKPKNTSSNIISHTGKGHGDPEKIPRNKLLRCNICKQSPIVLPTAAGCDHYFCYYCITATLISTSGEDFLCPDCSSQLKKEYIDSPVHYKHKIDGI